MTAQLANDATPAQQEEYPIPTRIIADFFPTTVRLPDDRLRHNVRVQATDVGLYVFADKPPADDLSGALFFSPIVWAETTNQRPPARVSFVIMTELGGVAVTQLLGCGCAYADLKYWTPAWVSRSLPWGGGAGA